MTGNALTEQMFSGLPAIADIRAAVHSRRFVPLPDSCIAASFVTSFIGYYSGQQIGTS